MAPLKQTAFRLTDGDLDILDQVDDNLVLHEDFQSTLMAGRLRSVFRPGKSLQDRMIEAVRKHLQKTQPQEVNT